jgi:hypothetical protein
MLIVIKSNYYSIDIPAVTYANYKLIAVDVGSFGKDSDAGVFDNCPLRRVLTSGKIKIPDEKYLPGSRGLCSHRVPYETVPTSPVARKTR